MNPIIALSKAQRVEVFNQAGAELGLPPFYVEKDFWVCWVLGVLFADPRMGGHLTFRGGTSLSKGWGLIARFSEDVDLTIARTWVDDTLPDPGEAKITSAQRDRRLQQLRRACRQAIRERLVPALEAQVNQLDEGARVEVEDLNQARDPFVIAVHYPAGGLAVPGDYHQAIVKIELSGRADDWPQEQREIQPFVQQAFPHLGAWDALRVACVKPERTFWEKASLLHEQNTRPEVQPLAARQARHLYDLVRLWEHVGNDASLGKLFNSVRAHRKVFFNYTWVDYDALRPGGLQLLPPEGSRDHWRADYAAMEPMFFEPPPTFSDLLARIVKINERLAVIR